MWLMRITLCALALGMPAAFALDDPTRPPDARSATAAPSEQRSYSLDSIVIGLNRRTVVIDGVTRSEGDRFGQARLVKIYPHKVVLSDQGQARVLHWKMPPKVRVSP